MKITRLLAATTVIGLVGMAPSVGARPADAKAVKSDNVKVFGQIKYEGGTELAADGKYLYSGEMDGTDNRGQDTTKGGIHIIDVSGKRPKEVGYLKCPGNDNDVEVVKPGLLVLSFHVNQCVPAAGNGFAMVDVSNPKKPRIVGFLNTGKNHTVKPVPGTDLIYTAGGGLAGGGGAGPTVVDVSNPSKPEIVARPQTLTMDCHDISFHMEGDRPLGFCAGAIGTGEVKIWDMSDPLAPAEIGHIFNPLIQYSHYAVANTEGTLLAIDDEAFAAHECATGQSPTGRVWLYDITDPTIPIPAGSYAAPRGGGELPVGMYTGPYGWVPSWCLSHGLDWQPGTNNLAVTWFTGGMSVLNLDNPLMPAEVAYYQADPSATYSVLWHKKYLYSNDMYQGVIGYKIKGLPK